MYENIVVAYDGSDFSKSALTEAASWIKRHGGQAVLVHAVYFDEEEFGAIPEQIEKRVNFGKKICYQVKEEVDSALGVNLESIVCEGDPPDTIVEIATAKKADLIAMGTRGRKGIKRMLMGSVTSGVIANAPCDVLVVKKTSSDCAGQYTSLLVPFDGSEPGKKALSRACSIAAACSGSVTVMYVVPRYEEMIEFFRTSSIKESLMNEAQKITAKGVELALEKGIQAKALIENGDAGRRIADTAVRERSDLIVMGSHGWSGVNKAVLGSTTERVVMYAGSPVLVVR